MRWRTNQSTAVDERLLFLSEAEIHGLLSRAGMRASQNPQDNFF
jgi:hypothetical protein